MMHKDYKKICFDTLPIVKKVASFIRAELGKVQKEQIEEKGMEGLVSYVDRQAEVMLVEALGNLLPGCGFVTEEGTVAQRREGEVWIIDPLDGTNNFLHQIPHFAISVALKIDADIVVGVVLEVNSGECFYAYRGGGAYLNDRPIQVSQTDDLGNALLATGFPYRVPDVAPLIRTLGHFMRHARGLRRMGSAALDLAYVACGRVDAYYETTLHAWDVAAGILIVQEAGGTVTDFAGGDDYLFGGNIVASNHHVHQSIVGTIAEKYY